MLDELEGCPDTSFEREVICDGDDTFLLSTDNMKALKKFHESVIKKLYKYFTDFYLQLYLIEIGLKKIYVSNLLQLNKVDNTVFIRLN